MDDNHEGLVDDRADDRADSTLPDSSTRTDSSTLPDWWREAIREFEAYDLGQYRPPRFADGVVVHRVVERLESAQGVEIALVATDATYGDDWNVRVDDESIGAVGRRRSHAGYTVYEISSAAFEAMIRSSLR